MLDSCEAAYYCTHDTSLQTWCCPDEMDLEECAAAYSVTGGLETPAEPTTSVAPTTTSVAPTTTSTTSTSTTPSVTSTPTPTSTPHSTTSCTSSVWTSANSTTTSHSSTKIETHIETEVIPPPASDTVAPEPSAEPTGGASASGVSLALLAAAAGLVALF